MGRHVVPLTSIRGLAALWVALFHARISFLCLDPTDPFLSKGYLAVDLFFILSGYVLAMNYKFDRQQLTRAALIRFLRFRLARIYPLHVACLSILVIMECARYGLDAYGWHTARVPAFTATTSPLSLLTNLFLMQSWGMHDILTWNGPAWSISAEWFAYLLFPFLSVAITSLPKRPLFLFGFVAVCLGALNLLRLYDRTDLGAVSEGGLLRCLLEFTAGIALYHLRQNLRAKIPDWGSLVATVSTIVMILAGVSDFIVCFGLAAVIFCLATDTGAVARFLSKRAFVFLGEISFALYMVHHVAFYIRQIGYRALGAVATDAYSYLDLGLTMALIIGVSTLMYNFIEVPARRLLRGESSPLPREAEVAEAPQKISA